eukprot:PhM_4_TR3509/c0_g3_i1/m.39140
MFTRRRLAWQLTTTTSTSTAYRTPTPTHYHLQRFCSSQSLHLHNLHSQELSRSITRGARIKLVGRVVSVSRDATRMILQTEESTYHSHTGRLKTTETPLVTNHSVQLGDAFCSNYVAGSVRQGAFVYVHGRLIQARGEERDLSPTVFVDSTSGQVVVIEDLEKKQGEHIK